MKLADPENVVLPYKISSKCCGLNYFFITKLSDPENAVISYKIISKYGEQIVFYYESS